MNNETTSDVTVAVMTPKYNDYSQS